MSACRGIFCMDLFGGDQVNYLDFKPIKKLHVASQLSFPNCYCMYQSLDQLILLSYNLVKHVEVGGICNVLIASNYLLIKHYIRYKSYNIQTTSTNYKIPFLITNLRSGYRGKMVQISVSNIIPSTRESCWRGN